MPRSSRMSARTLSTCAWIETSRAATDSSRMSTRGSVARARAIATRWRWPPDRAFGMALICRWSRPTTSASSPTIRLRSVGVVVVVDAQHLVDQVGAGLARVEAGVRVLEDDLHLAAAQLALGAATGGLRAVASAGDDRARPSASRGRRSCGRRWSCRCRTRRRWPATARGSRSKVTSSTATWVPNTLRSPRTCRTGSSVRPRTGGLRHGHRPGGFRGARRRARSGRARRRGRS